MKTDWNIQLQDEQAIAFNQDKVQHNRFLLEAKHYTDPTILELEKAAIFRRSWLYVGDATPLNQPGSVLVTEVADCSVLITRTADGELKAFHNVCPHRASPFITECGVHSVKHLVCPYHAWVYNLDGELVGTPSKDRFATDFCFQDYPLQAVQVAVWENFLFVCLDPLAPPLLTVLGSIPATIAGYRSEATQLLVKRHYEVKCNWKNYHDNTLCDYHVAIAHRKTLNPVQGPIRFYEYAFDEYTNLLYTPTTPHWRSTNSVLEHLPDRNRLGFFTFGIFPNLHLLALPNGILSWLRIDPITVDRCRVELEIYGTPGISPPVETIERDFEEFMQEDMTLTEGVQRGYASGAYTPGAVNNLEARIVHQQRLIAAYLANAY